MIRKVNREDLPQCLEIIHKSYETEASMFGVTKMNCPNHTSFMPIENEYDTNGCVESNIYQQYTA